MSFSKFYIIENLQSFEITIKDVKGFLDRLPPRRSSSRYPPPSRALNDSERRLEFFYDNYEKYKKDFDYFLQMYSEEGRKIINFLIERGVPYISTNQLKYNFLTAYQEFPRSKSDLYPVPVYISSSPEDKMTIGIMVYEDGKLEMFEGNEEATPETLAVVNKLLYPSGKKVKVYANHDQKVVDKIKTTGILPPRLFVSPRQDVASGHWGENRVMFSGTVNLNDLNQASDVDWMTMGPTKIENIRVY